MDSAMALSILAACLLAIALSSIRESVRDDHDVRVRRRNRAFVRELRHMRQRR